MKFRTKLIVGIASIEVVFLLVIVLSALNFLTDSNRELFQNKMDTALSLLQQSSIDALLTYDIARLESLANDLLSDPDVLLVKIEMSGTEVVRVGQQVDLSLPLPQEYIVRERDISIQNQSIGTFYLLFDGRRVDAVVYRSGIYLGSIALFATVILVLVTFVFGWVLTKELFKLSEASKKIEQTGPGYTVAHQNRDEIGQVIDAFNHMSVAMANQYQQLERSEQQAVAANKAKDDFLALMSHEIRTPLNGILTMSKIMEAELSGDHKAHCKVINQSGEHLLLILNDILDFSKLEQGKLELTQESFHIEEVIQLVQSFFRAQCVTKGITLTLNNSIASNVIWHGDKVRLKQIIFNLMSNAIKFTSHGEVTVTFSAGTGQKSLNIEVLDTGTGIEKEKLESILQPFTQAHSTITRDYGGTGLGLAIVNRLVSLMDGQLEVRSTVGTGSVFTVRLRLASELKKTMSSGANLASAKQLNDISWRAPEGARVLLVDDNKINLIVGKKWCQKLGFVADVAGGHSEAMKKLFDREYLCLLVDHHMPEVSGIELVKKMLAVKPDLLIFGWTADVSEQSYQNFMDAGAKGVLGKPLDINEFSDVVIRNLSRDTA
ncbi:ATP-binding protein [Vibrio sp. 10N]|uniref:ATP-binding protein n=1 Tax=Vibrio sp. 10N TaxID=3058938 RepID=UPI002813EB24|nr:hypothetical protein VB10N_43970 [Vibrio sp. 10N]